MTATPTPPRTDTTSLPAEGGFIGSGQEGGVVDQVRAYVQRVRHGDMGALPAIGGLVVLVILFAILSETMLGHQYFLTERNFANLLTQAASLVMLAMALTLTILLGEIDLSAGVTSGVALSAFVVLTKPDGINMNWILALVIALAVGMLIGTFIGFFVARVGIPSFVVTLGLFIGLQGVTLILLGDGGVFRIQIPEFLAIQNANMPIWAGWVMLGVILALSFGMSMWDRFRRTRAGVPNRTIALVWIKLGVIAVLGGLVVGVLSSNRSSSIKVIEGVPIVLPIVLVILWLGTFMLDRTKFGRYIYAIGGNAEAARRSGIKVISIKWLAFVLGSTLAVVAGVFSASKVGSINSGFGTDTVLSGVAAAVVGGVSLFGGRGRLMRAAIGALVIAVIANGLGLLNLPAGMNYIVTGGVLVLAATVDAVSRVRAGGSVIRT
jgi:D-xylose transport system permease protein